MTYSRGTSPMPPNIDELKESLPRDSIGYYDGVTFPVMYRINDGYRRLGTKMLIGAGALTGLYGAYRLGKHMGSDKFNKVHSTGFHYPRSNYTRSGA